METEVETEGGGDRGTVLSQEDRGKTVGGSFVSKGTGRKNRPSVSTFRGDAYYLIASEWCRKNGISYRDRRKPEEKLTDSIFSDERLSNRALEDSIKPGRYHHYKGNEYEVLCLAKHSETEELMVVYKALYGEGQVWARPASMWNETVVKDEQEIKRFTFLGTTIE